jgi:hypothetical protein
LTRESARNQAEPLSDPQKQQLTALSEDLMALWNHPGAPIQLKKRILRTVLTEIIIDNVSFCREGERRMLRKESPRIRNYYRPNMP